MALDLTMVGVPRAPVSCTYKWNDTVLYALGIGAKVTELDYLFEGRGPRVMPTFGVVPMFGPMFDILQNCGANMTMLVHGSQRLTLHKPLPPQATVHTTATVRGFYDLKRMAVGVIDIATRDDAGALIAENTSTIIFRGDGGFDGVTPPRAKTDLIVPKDGEPSFAVREATTPEAALLYRLNGDINPLHADPEFAAKAGFAQGPILHGLCTYGYVARHIVNGVLGGDGDRLVTLDGSFKKPVWPGDTLETRGYLIRENHYAIELRVVERDEVVLVGWAITK
jgi:acyl dehydratase